MTDDASPVKEKVGFLLALRNRATVSLLTKILEPQPMSAFGMNIFGATSIGEAREALEVFVPDIVVIDLDLPDSWPLVEQSLRDFPQTEIIAVTSLDQRADFARRQGIGHVLTASGEEDFIGALLHLLGVDDGAGARGPGVVLAVDHNEESAALYAFLMHSGYDVRIATTAPDALEALEKDPQIHLVVADIHLADGGALGLVRETAQRFPHAGAIVMTGVQDSEVVRLALSLGAFDCLVKPVQPDRVISAIEACLAHIEYRGLRPWWKRIWGNTA
jgi:DNA-binding NtrC family response regulator